MITKLRKFGETEFVDVEHHEDDCAACQAALGVKWSGAGLIFFENEQGLIRRVENVGFPVLAFLCGEVTREEVIAERGITGPFAYCVEQFELEPMAEDSTEKLFDKLQQSGMRRLNCEQCGTDLLTRGTSNLCPPCRRKKPEP